MTTETTAQKLYWLQRQIDGAITFLVITIFFVGLKLVATGVQTCKTKTAVGARSVVFAVAALIPFVPLAALTIVNAKAYKSFYQDSSIVEQEQYFTIIQKTFYGFSVLYPIACVLPKLSICFMYLRLFEVSIWVARTSKLLVVFLLLNTIAWLVPSVVVCQPIAVYWSPSGEEGRCIDINVFGTWISLPHIVSDLVMLVLPLPTLWKMQMRRAKKIGVIFTIVTGSFGLVAACARLAYYVHDTYVSRAGTEQTVKSIALETMFSLFEPGSYLVAACLPSLRIIFKQLYTKWGMKS